MSEILELLQEALDELLCAHGASGVDDKHIGYASRRVEDALNQLKALEDPHYALQWLKDNPCRMDLADEPCRKSPALKVAPVDASEAERQWYFGYNAAIADTHAEAPRYTITESGLQALREAKLGGAVKAGEE